MVLNSEEYYQSIIKKLMIEKENIGDLSDDDLDPHIEILTVARGNMDAGSFGPYQKPPLAASRMGFFLPETDDMQRKLKNYWNGGMRPRMAPYVASLGTGALSLG